MLGFYVVITLYSKINTCIYSLSIAFSLDVKTKEMLGLVASMVLRCDDCIKYHLGKCHEAGVNSEEMNEIFMIANLVGGSIVIPHYRRAVEYWDELNA